MKPTKQDTVKGYVKPNMVGSTACLVKDAKGNLQFPEYLAWETARLGRVQASK